MIRVFLVVTILLLLLCLCGCRTQSDVSNPYWWSPLEVPLIEEKFEYDDSGVPIVERVGGDYEVELSYPEYTDRADTARVIELLEANNKLLEEIEDD